MIPSVLLVDYDPRSIRRLRNVLQECGAQALLATNGNAAIDAFRTCSPDLVLVQDLLPGRHGFDVCKEIKSIEGGRTRPVVLLFSPRPGRRNAARATGCDAILDKPFEDQALVALVRRFLPAEPPAPAAVEEIDSVLDSLFAAPVAAAVPPSEERIPSPKRRRSSSRRSKRARRGPSEPAP
jgi:CheY-like chemotaxis protein